MVAATLSPSGDCSGKQEWSCAVPPDPEDAGTVDVSFSIDGGMFHAFAPPLRFSFTPEVACDLDGAPDFPAGCTVDMLANGVCDDACNERRCASDSRDCAAPPVVVAPDGDDAADGE